MHMEDDGSLACLKIPEDKSNKHFNCPETTQQKLINLSFWIMDYLDDVKTKFGSNRYLVKIKFKGCPSLGVLFGGRANNGSNAGFAYANTNNAPSNANANIRSRQYWLKIWIRMEAVPLGKKQSL